jgi:hypothetical protein
LKRDFNLSKRTPITRALIHSLSFRTPCLAKNLPLGHEMAGVGNVAPNHENQLYGQDHRDSVAGMIAQFPNPGASM